MEALAKASGGSAIFPESLAEVVPAAVDIAQEIRNQYIIAYTPTNQELDGKFRQIKVTANGPGRPQVRTRSGYFATPQGVGEADNTSASSNNSPRNTLIPPKTK
jgi:VWFA-related protein